MTRPIVIIVALALIAPASASAAAEFPGYPEKSYSFPYFGTPSGKIVCEYRSKRVTCTNFTVSNLRQRTWYAGTKGHAHHQPIGGNFPTQDLPKARYNVTYAYKGIKCRIHTLTGIKCWNASGHGFQVSVQKQRVF